MATEDGGVVLEVRREHLLEFKRLDYLAQGHSLASRF